MKKIITKEDEFLRDFYDTYCDDYNFRFGLDPLNEDDISELVERLEELYHSTSALITAIEEYHKLE